SPRLLLAEAAVPGEGAHAEGGNMEIFIEAVAGNVALSNTANATGFSTEDRKALRGHLRAAHGASAVPCASRACPLLFPSRAAMERHRRSHLPFHCGRCAFATANARLFGQHRRGHAAEPSRDARGAESTGSPAGCGLQQRRVLPSEPTGTRQGSLEGQKASTGEEDSESGGDESLEEDGESPCEGEPKENGKEAPEKAKVPRAQHVTGDVVEGSEYLYKTHMCPECKRCFKKRTHLVEHLHLHFPDPSLQCPNCHKFFTSKSKLKIHMMRETGEKAHRCPLCHYSSVEKNALNRHMASMHEDISNFYSDVYSCPVCEEKFRLSQALKEHLKTHKAEPKRLSCFQGGCDYFAEDRKEFIRHLKDAHGIKAVECKYHACSLLFGTAEAMEAHRKTHYAFHCQQCDFICSNKHVFRKHKKQGHPGSEQLQCSFCPYATFNPVEFHDHVGKMHANEKIHKCTECPFATAHKRVLIRHMLLHTGEKPHKCELCDFTCRDVSYLSKHMLTHSDDKNFMCTECGYITKWKHYLNVHMRKHTGDLRYQCNQCSYRCHRADQLSSHKLRHQGKSLICEVCGFACKRKYELQKHMQAKHSQNYQVPIFQCQYCTYQTKYKQEVLNHENCKHTKQKEFRCALCSYCTFSNTSLFFHKRKVHGYVPGDKDWLENYASKEQEISSSEALFGCELGTALRSDAASPLSGKEQWAKAKPPQPESQGEESSQQALAVPLQEQGAAVPEGSTELARGEGEGERGCPGAASAQADPASGSADFAPSGDVVESCTLHLETLNVPSDSVLEHLAGDACTSQPESAEMLVCKEPPAAYEVLGSRDDLGLEDNDNALEDIPDFEEDETDACCREGSCSGLRELVADAEMRENSPVELPTAWLQALETAERSCPPPAEDAAASADEAKGGSESVLKALRKQDKEQAETLVLEGRVQMLVVQSESQIFKCEKCSYVTRKEKSMSLHSRASCQRRRAPLVCPECGASFKQQRGLNTHLLKKCPVLLKKNRALKPAIQELPGLCQPASQPGGSGPETSESDRGGLEESGHHETPWEMELISDKTQPSGNSSTDTVEEPSKQGDPAEPGGAVFPSQPGRTSEKYRAEGGKLHCNACAFVCSRVSTITSHVEDGSFCPLCDYGSYLQNDITRHVNSCHRGELNFGCSRCEARFSSETALKQHVLRRHEEKVPYGCPRCGFVCHSEATLKCHVQKQHPHLECGACKETFASRDALEEHKKQHFSHRCELCSFAAKERQQLVRHYVESHEPAAPQERPLRCPFCDFACRHQLVFDQHMKGHGGTRVYKCSDCEYTTKNRQKITWHIRIHTGEKPYKCHLCKYACADPSRLKYHMRIHKEERKYLCPECGYKCKWVNQLKYHMTKHTGLKPYGCDECEYRTNRADALRVHRETRHREARAFMCEQCGKAFKTRFLLKTHLKKHSEEKPYVCGACGRAFRWAAGLRHHHLTHTNEHPFFCRYCPYKAKQKFQVIKHIQRHHPERGAGDVSQGVGKEPSAGPVLLHELQREGQGPPVPVHEGGCPTGKDGAPQ
ncbi:Zinc finger protein 142, partial [Tinamus guttatus]